MFQANFARLALAFVAIAALASSIPTTLTTIAGKSFGCAYTVTKGAYFAEFPFLYDETKASSASDCMNACDQNTNCVAAAFLGNAPTDSKCLLQLQSTFSKVASKPARSGTFYQLVPNSCKKEAAKPHPIDCKQRTVTAPDGCKYHILCDQVLNELATPVVYEVRDVNECIVYLRDSTLGLGMTYTNDGTCTIQNSNHYKKFSFHFEPHTESALIVKGSCSKKPANAGS